MTVKLQQLRHFVTLADAGSFTLAAERLHMAQPPLSVSIRKLEEELGTELFTRYARGVALTPSGAAALMEARRALFHSAEAVRAARAASSGVKGRFKLGFASSSALVVLPKLLRAYRQQFPEVQIALRERDNTTLVEALLSGELDVGIIRSPSILPPEVSLVEIERDTLSLVVSREAPLAYKKSIVMADLANEEFVNYTASGRIPGLNAIVQNVFLSAGIAPRVVQEALQINTLIGLVAAGIGCALIPSKCRVAALPDVIFRQIDDLPAAGGVGSSFCHLADLDNKAALALKDLAIQQSIA
ncbi:LysR substrate-binding domain-containing protein [Aureimonas flava]|uniref:LysR substrate-binding domain-containing protein n=1 Tax=Aureimonas flava TaxID=2320271 RepID=UPI00145A0184|nr:LysR substrate-binding domain-containing protein [Aureimonas flava]